MAPDEYHQLETEMKELEDHELRRLVAVEFTKYRPAAVEIARDELRHRRLPLLSAKEYWEQFPEEWLSGVGFCYRCWTETTDESPEHTWTVNLIGTRLIGGDDLCSQCGSSIQRMWFCIVIPVIPLDSYRILRLNRSEWLGRKLREIDSRSE